MKDKLIITFKYLVIIFSILFAVQLIDNKVNGDDYKKIENFIYETKLSIIKSGCYLDYKKPNIPENRYKIDKTACDKIAKEIVTFKTPEIKIKSKRKLMNKWLINNQKVITSGLAVHELKKVEELPPVIYNAKFAELQTQISQAELRLTYSIKDIILKRPVLCFVKIMLYINNL